MLILEAALPCIRAELSCFGDGSELQRSNKDMFKQKYFSPDKHMVASICICVGAGGGWGPSFGKTRKQPVL